jgi:hypothetical protein
MQKPSFVQQTKTLQQGGRQMKVKTKVKSGWGDCVGGGI